MAITKVTKRLDGVDNCTSSHDDFQSLLAVHSHFEKWFVGDRIFSSENCDISSILEKMFRDIQYHPIIENFPEYESLRRPAVPYNDTDKFNFPHYMVPG